MSKTNLQQIESIGSSRAETLQKAGFETIDQLREASEDELMTISGIGRKLAHRIKTELAHTRQEIELDEDRFTITGRIKASDTGDGIHGLLVEIWVGDPPRKQVETVRTGRDGRFGTTITKDDGRSFDWAVSDRAPVTLRLRDREDTLIYTTEDSPKAVSAGTVTDISWTLEPDDLAAHRSRPVSMDPPAGSLIPDEVWHDMEEAVSLLAAPGERGHNAFLKGVKCPGPPLDDFGNGVIQDGWETGQGDIDAADRFRETLDTLIAYRDETSHDSGVSVRREEIESMIEGGDGSSASGEHMGRPDTGGPHVPENTVVSPSKAVPLVLGAIGSSGDDRDQAVRALQAVSEQLCQAEIVGHFHRAGRDALTGGDRSLERWRGFVRRGVMECGPDDGPVPGDDDGPGFPIPPRRPGKCVPPFDRHDIGLCVDDAIRKIVEAGVIPGGGNRYVVTGVSPSRACPGDVITITGRNFGSHPGRVYFEHGIRGTVLSWTDSRIRVRVPQGAGCGLRLSSKAGTVEICGRFVDIYRQGDIKADFEGTAAKIIDFRVNGDQGPVRVDPGGSARIAWETCAADSIRIRIRDDTGTVLASQSPSADTGTWTYSVPTYASTEELTATITVEGRCQPSSRQQSITMWVHKVPAPSMQGLEVTQALQHFRANQHLNDSSDIGPDNSLQLVAGKPAWVRVYLRSGQDSSFNNGAVNDVTGQLVVEQNQNGVWSTVTTLTPTNTGGTTTARANPSYANERGNIGATLNFAVPANQMQGQMRFRVEIEAPDPYEGTITASRSTIVNVNLQQTLRIAGIMVGYNGPDRSGNNLQLNAPNINDLQNTATAAYAMFPVASPTNANFRIAGTITQNQPLTGNIPPGGGCPQSWSNLMSQLRNVMTADPNQNGWVFYGLLANGIPMGPVIGCGGGGLGTGSVGAQMTLAHEAGHALGLRHAPCGNPPRVDGSYPAYEPYDSPNNRQAVIGPYGLNINNGTVRPPQSRDLMSYCGNQWISKYHHNSLLNVGRLSPTPVAPSQTQPTTDGGQVDATRRRISITGHVDRTGEIVVESVARIETNLDLSDAVRTDMVAELVDREGEIIATASVYAIQHQTRTDRHCADCGPTDEPPYVFQALVPDRAPGGELRIRDSEEVRWSRTAPEATPVIEEIDATVDEERALSIAWETQDWTEDASEAWIRWSADEGETWNVLTVGVRDNATTLDVSHLPAGDIVFQVLVHDGFHTATAISDVVTVPPQPPTVTIMHPSPEDTIPPGVPIRLWAIVNAADGTELADETYRWMLDGEEVATGADVFIPTPGPGEHELRVHVEAPSGEATRGLTFEVAKLGEEDG